MRYFIGLFITLGLLFLLIFLLFHGGGSKSRQPQLTAAGLSGYATSDAVAQLTIDGPVNADQLHQIVRITVGRDNVTYEQISGYQNTVVNSQIYASNEQAYVNFLLALAHAGFTQGNPDPRLKDERGICPLADRYVFQFNQDGNDLERYWATSCGAKTYRGALGLTLSLFEAQVPHYQALTRGLSL